MWSIAIIELTGRLIALLAKEVDKKIGLFSESLTSFFTIANPDFSREIPDFSQNLFLV
jgi:hypothetical protein